MRLLAHISDLHFGTTRPQLVNGLLDSLRAANPDLVIISGDFTQRARRRQFQAARAFLERLPAPWLGVPGNHDVPLYSWRRFWQPLRKYRQYITNDLAPVFRDDEVAILGLNTARAMTTKHGRLSASQIRLLRREFLGLPDHLCKILVTHHPFLPPPHKLKKTLLWRAGHILGEVRDCSPDLLLAGHFHMSYAGSTETFHTHLQRSTLVIQAGTATSQRLRNRELNAYNLIGVRGFQIELKVLRWNGEAFVQEKTEEYSREGERWLSDSGTRIQGNSQ